MNSRPNSSKEQDDFDVFEALEQFTSRWYWFAIAVPLFLAAAIWYNYQVVPLHSIKAKILVEDDKGTVIYSDDAMRGMDHLFRTKTVNNEIQVLRSRDLIATALDSLNLNVTYFNAFDLSEEFYSAEMPFEVRADFSEAGPLDGMAFRVDFREEGSFDLSVDGELLGTYVKGQIINYLGVPIIMDRNRNYKEQAWPEQPVVFYINSDDATIDSYVRRLQVSESDKDTEAIILSIDEVIPKRGKAFLNALIEAYFYDVLEDRRQIAENTYDFIDGRLRMNFSHLDSVETAIDLYKRANRITDPSRESNYILEGIKDFEVELNDAETQLRIFEGIRQNAEKDENGDLDLSIPQTMLGVTDPLLNGLLQDLKRKQQELARLSQTVDEKNPLYQGRLKELEGIRRSVNRELVNMEHNLVTSVAKIEKQIKDYKAQLSDLSYDELGLTAMERVRDNKAQLYIYLLEKREEAAMVLASEIMDTWVLETPYVADYFYRTKRSIVLAIGVFLGLFFPSIIILLYMLFDGKVREEREIERLLERPALGRLAKAKKPRRKSAGVSPILDTLSAESLKRLTMNLNFIDQKYKVVLVSSMKSGEGKTHTALNMALASGAIGKKTCLLELDLRRPTLGRKLNAPSEKSVIDLLAGTASIDELIQTDPDHPNTHFLCSDVFPLDPTSLLMGATMDRLIATLKQRYQCIIIDTPPLGAVTDAMILSRFADINLVVVRRGVSKKRELIEMKKQLQAHGTKNVAVLFNGVKAKSMDSYYRQKKNGKRLDLRGFKETPGPVITKDNGIREPRSGK